MLKLSRLTILFLSLVPFTCMETYSQQAAQSQKRLALVIGNGNYTSSILANPENDAADISNVLRLMGFKVIFHLNMSLSGMREAIDDFGMQLPDYDVGLFYYAGHGIQAEGRNFLVPVDARITIERMIQFNCVEVDRILAYMEEAKTEVNIIILDACRNNPFERSWTRALGGPGLASMDAPKGTLIAYATAPNKTASDGSGRNGLYTSAILESIVNPDATAIQIFQNVTSLVLNRSNQQQIPWLASSLTADFYFNPYKVSGKISQTSVPYYPAVRVPVVQVPTFSDVTSSSARVNVKITSDGGEDIFERGVCYSPAPDPSLKKGIQIKGEGEYDSYFCKMNGLDHNKTYYVRAYAINSAGTSYSLPVSFKTDLGKPVIAMDEVSRVTSTLAFASAHIADDGGAPILLKGFCWSTIPHPIARNKDLVTQNGKGKEDFKNPIGPLLPDTTYYLRPYCSNNGKDTVYGPEINFRTLRTDQFMDVEGNVYGSAGFVNLIWMTENLRTTKLNDGTQIPLVTENAAWSSQVSAAYCWYGNKETNKQEYGALYNWEAVKSGKLCPAGWHMPTDEEWEMFNKTYGGNSFAGGYLKERGLEHWLKPNTGGESFYNRFNALPGGERDEMGEFNKIGMLGVWWSDVDPRKGVSWTREMTSNSAALKRDKTDNNSVGYSVRCVKNQD